MRVLAYCTVCSFRFASMVRLMAPILFVMLFAFPQCFCSAQEFVGSGNGLNETADCNENISCIDKYHDLESYVISNKEVIEGLKSAFFYTGEAPTKFVKLLYNYTVYNESVGNCFNSTSKYIWSDSALYLLGPKTLAWFTFFAVDTPEITTTVDLPCLCDEVYNSLLSRLTYMVCRI